MRKGVWKIGIDEAGRGPLAGPVAVAIVALSPNFKFSRKNLADSKKLSEKNREEWFARIKKWQKEGKLRYSCTLISNKTIDKEGIVKAIGKGIEKSLKNIKLSPAKEKVSLDGGLKAPLKYKNQKTFIKGDENIPEISLASIVAKVTRDRKMKSLAKKYPKYLFEIHKGYGTSTHCKLIRKYGLSTIHRKTFIKF